MSVIDINNAKKGKFIVDFKKEYEFEGRKIKAIDLSKLEEMTCTDLTEMEKNHRLRCPEEANMPIKDDMSTGFAICAAQLVSGLPFEFFDILTIADVLNLKTEILGFLYS